MKYLHGHSRRSGGVKYCSGVSITNFDEVDADREETSNLTPFNLTKHKK